MKREQHGGDIFRNAVRLDFSANINPLGMPAGCGEAFGVSFSASSQYPDPEAWALCQAIAETEQVAAWQVVPGNGASELIYSLCQGVRPRRALVTAPAFSEYEAGVRASGGRVVHFMLREEEGFEVPVEQFIRRITDEVQLVFLGSPNNPTGCLITAGNLERIAARCEAIGAVLCVDECFLPFLEREPELSMKWKLGQYPHLVVLRAFTKFYGMPGLRLGYALTGREVGERIRQCLPPWNISAPAQAVGIEALKDRAFADRSRALVREEKAFLLREMEMGLADRIYASEANYIFFKSRPDLKDRLLEQGILIRDCENYRGLGAGYFRIAVRTRAENEELVRTWRSLQHL